MEKGINLDSSIISEKELNDDKMIVELSSKKFDETESSSAKLFLDNLILTSANDPTKIEKIARILVAKKQYLKALYSIRFLLKNFETIDLPHRRNLVVIFDTVYRFLIFKKNYEFNKQEIHNMYSSQNWYVDLLIEYIVEKKIKKFNYDKMKLFEELEKLLTLLRSQFDKEEFINMTIDQLSEEYKKVVKNKLFELKDTSILKNIHDRIFHQFSAHEHKNLYSFILGNKNNVESFTGQEKEYFSSIAERLKFPYAQSDINGFIFLKSQTYLLQHIEKKPNPKSSWGNKQSGFPLYIEKFPIRQWELSKNVVRPNPECDVLYIENPFDVPTHNLIKNLFDKLSILTKDYHGENYQNIIDPNLCVIEEFYISQDYSGKNITRFYYTWAATDFMIKEKEYYGMAIPTALKLFCKYKNKAVLKKNVIKNIFNFINNKKIPEAKITTPINNLDPLKNIELHVISEKILTAALPMLSHLSKPALLLPGKLQAVMKAQRVYIKYNEEYEGVWHRDGKEEHIVAVVIYYYRCSDGLIGGDLEFVDKRPIKDRLWLHGDCDPENYTEEQFKNDFEFLPKARVPIKAGTLVVFSNYQMIHRVLKIIHDDKIQNDPDSPDLFCSRDFVLFFIVDQSKPIRNTQDYSDNCSYSGKYTEEFKKEIRDKLFHQQLKPTGRFGIGHGYVYSTGNGSVAELGWKNGSFSSESSEDDSREIYEREGIVIMRKLNKPPPLKRGVSWAFEENLYEESEEIYDYDDDDQII